MTNPYQMFKCDQNIESGEGFTIQYKDEKGKVAFSITIHRAGGSNKKYGNVFARKMKPHRQRFDRGTLDEDTSNKILLESFVEGVVVGWKDVTDEKGKKITFNVENCLKFFTDLPDLYADVKAQANDVSNFRTEQEEVEIKN